MTDPAEGMKSFQQALLDGEIRLLPGTLDPNLYVYQDKPNGEFRLSYVRLEGQNVTAFVVAAAAEPHEGKPCLQIGYAVPEAYRGQGRAAEATIAAIAEMKHGFGRNGIKTMFLEAIVGADNAASKRVAERVFSCQPTEITDDLSGQPAFQYIQEVECA